MQKRLRFYLGLALFVVLVTLVVWQSSFTFGSFGPSGVEQTYLFWAVATLIFILTVMLGFMLFRTAVRLYIERQSNRAGSHIKSKLIVGALMLTFLPVAFLVAFSFLVLNYNLNKWFSAPTETILTELINMGQSLDREGVERATAEANWLASILEKGDLTQAGKFCADAKVGYAALFDKDGKPSSIICGKAGCRGTPPSSRISKNCGTTGSIGGTAASICSIIS